MLHAYFLNDPAYCEQKAAALGLQSTALTSNESLVAAATGDLDWYAPAVMVSVGSRSTVPVTVYRGRAAVDGGAILVELAKEDVSRAESVLDLVLASLGRRAHGVEWWLPHAASHVLFLHDIQQGACVKETVITDPSGTGRVYVSIYGY
jgi:hypothetical protein